MGSYDQEMELVAQGLAERGKTARDYLAELDEQLSDEESLFQHRPDYSKTLYAAENDDIYREFCRFYDQAEPRYLDGVENPLSVNGHTAADVYFAMKSKNNRIVDIDAVAVYNTLVNLRRKPKVYEKVLDFRPTCYQGGCGKEDAAYEAGCYGEGRFPKK